ncbi:MAG: T9SS type A sorting domain-containing protein [Bacteroidetes bacterium]|nr:T9SS type A sorting domain-containing protein [Bacteroidota bacterium]
MKPILFFLLLISGEIIAQESVIPLQANRSLEHSKRTSFAKKTRAILPFVDDFSYPGPYPDAALWVDSQAYINNTMSATPMTRGIATLDGLNAVGRPYVEQQFQSGYADSLTSVPIDLSSYSTSSNIYLSFFYQPQGLGFAPESADSLYLFFKNKQNQWVRMWETRGTPLQIFKPIMKPVTDTQFLHSNFQFRFVNWASLNINDDVWNLDYIKLDANRPDNDSIMNDIAFTVEPTSILKNYQSMPYRHFMVNQANELSTKQDVEVRNLHEVPKSVTVNLNAIELNSSTAVNSQTLPTTAVAAKSYFGFNLLSYPITYTAPNIHSKVVVRNTYFFPSVGINDVQQNDTIIRDAIFDNYFAYDDGSAEKSYFLLNAINFPSKTAIDFTLNEPDTLRGMMVHFGAQVPTAAGKYFSMVLYKSLGSGAINDSIILQEDLFQVQYEPSYNGFSTYAFTNPPVLAAGTYYIGITQPANFGSDSIYYGLDVNTNTSAQHLSYNVDGTWYNSTITGTVMMRPIVGQAFTPTKVQTITKNRTELQLYPNPVNDLVQIVSAQELQTTCAVYTLDGKFEGYTKIDNHSLHMAQFNSGMHLLVFTDKRGNRMSKIINKL